MGGTTIRQSIEINGVQVNSETKKINAYAVDITVVVSYRKSIDSLMILLYEEVSGLKINKSKQK
jgi:hypothetical protein